MTVNLLHELGLRINPGKSAAIMIRNGKIDHGIIETANGSISTITADDEIRYLGVAFNRTLIFNATKILRKLQENLESITATHLLQPHQKLTVTNQFIGPALSNCPS